MSKDDASDETLSVKRLKTSSSEWTPEQEANARRAWDADKALKPPYVKASERKLTYINGILTPIDYGYGGRSILGIALGSQFLGEDYDGSPYEPYCGDDYGDDY